MMPVQMKMLVCPICAVPQFFHVDSRIPVTVKCVNTGFRATEGSPGTIPECKFTFLTDDVHLVTLSGRGWGSIQGVNHV